MGVTIIIMKIITLTIIILIKNKIIIGLEALYNATDGPNWETRTDWVRFFFFFFGIALFHSSIINIIY